MITISSILTLILIAIVLVILFKLYKLIAAAVGIPEPWGQIIYWILVLLVVIWAFGFFGITQPIIR